jgi:rSAM/selenodomain-associated transferase 2
MKHSIKDPIKRALKIVVPVYNEDESILSWLQQVVGYLNAGDQLVVVDASDESTAERFSSHAIFQHHQVFYLKSAEGRAVQMNAGAEFLLSPMNNEKEEPSILWFLHSDSGLSNEHVSYLRALKGSVIWGRFDVQLSPTIFPFGIISKLMNLRSRFTQVMTGDQGIFIRCDVFRQLQGYAEISLMEDIEISKRLRVLAKADCDGPILHTSARRWQKHGWVKTVLLMWQLRLMYWLGVSPETLVKKYYG